MNIFNNIYIFLLSDLVIDKLFLLNKNILNFFLLKRNFLIKNSLIKNSKFIFILNKNKILLFLNLLLLNKDNILFFLFNNRLYSNFFINILIKRNVMGIKMKNYFLFFYNYIKIYIKKIIFFIKFNKYKKCQH